MLDDALDDTDHPFILFSNYTRGMDNLLHHHVISTDNFSICQIIELGNNLTVGYCRRVGIIVAAP
jgi:hypothetical protein